MNKTRFMMLVVVLVLSLALVGMALAADNAQKPNPPVQIAFTGTAQEAAGDSNGVDNIAGSFAAWDGGVYGNVCSSGGTDYLCFSYHVTTDSWAYPYGLQMKLPDGWNAINGYLLDNWTCANGGSPSTLTFTGGNTPNFAQTWLLANPADTCDAVYCMDVTTAGAGAIPWYITSDGFGGGVVDTCDNSGYFSCGEAIQPPAQVPPCAAGIYLTPESQTGSACEDASVDYTLNLFNNSGTDGTFALAYSSVFPISGPADIFVANGTTEGFSVSVTVPCGGTTDTATVTATGNGYSDISTLTTNVSTGGWTDEPASPTATMDQAVISYNDKLYVVDGYGSGGSVQIYDGTSWTTGASSGMNAYVSDACLGLDGSGNPVIDLFGDATTFFSMERYDINANAWTYPAFPPGFPTTGLWAPDIVSMYQHTGENVCYISGGATLPGGGNTNALYAYYPDSMTVVNLGNFSYSPVGIAFHFSWYAPWIGTEGAVCAGGGVDANSVASGDTQCFDLGTGTFNAMNADLGPLPLPWWGGGDAWKMNGSQYELWGLNGVDTGGAFLQKSFYWDGTAFVYGPDPLYSVYRMEAENFDGSIWAANGSTGGFTPSTLQESLVVCQGCVAPGILLVDDDKGDPDTNAYYTDALDMLGYPYTVWDTTVSGEPTADDLEPYQAAIWFTAHSYAAGPSAAGEAALATWLDGAAPRGFGGSTPFVPVAVGPSTGTPDNITVSSSNTQIGTPSVSANPQAVLWDQPLSTINQGAYVNQDFSDLPTYSAFLADDFVNDQPWVISTIFVPGDGWNGFSTLGNATSLTWQIYEDAAGIPAGDPAGGGDPPVWTLTLAPTDPQVVISAGTPGGFLSNSTLNLTTPVNLPAGHYWLVFYPTLEFATGGQYGRQSADTTNGYTGQIINPGGAWGIGTVWTAMSAIGVPGNDLAFRLEGEIGSAGPVRCFLLSAQDYLFNNGLTPFGSTYLGISDFLSDVGQNVVTGAGSVYSGLGPYTLSYPFYNWADVVNPDGTAEVAFTGDMGNAAIDKHGSTFFTTFAAFPFEAIATVEDRADAIDTFLTTGCGFGPAAAPHIAVDPTSLTATLFPNTQETQNLNVCNTGDADLTWSLAEVPGLKVNSVTPATAAKPVHKITLGLDANGISAPTGAAPVTPNGDVALVLDDGSRDNDIGIGGLQEFIWVNRFTPNTADFPFQINEVWIYFSSAGLVNVGDDIKIVFYENTTGGFDPAPGSNYLGGYVTTVQALDVWNVYTLPSPVWFNGPTGDAIIGVIGLEVPGSSYWPASIDQTVSQQRSWAGWWNVMPPPDPPILPPDASWILIDDYFPGNWMVRGYGMTGSDVIPWLSETPTEGIVLPGECAVINVTFDSTGLGLGTYSGALDIASNDPEDPNVVVPVTLNVVAPVIAVTPDALELTLFPNETGTLVFNIANNGTADLTWEATDGATWLSELPASGTVLPGESTDVDANFDSTGLIPGVYETNIVIASNDPATPEFMLPVTLTVEPLVSDLSIVKTGPENAKVGEVFTYTLVISNAGPQDAAGVMVIDTLPMNVAFKSASEGCIEDMGDVTCDVGALSMGETVTLHIAVTAMDVGTAVNTAVVSSDNNDPNPDNNTSTVTTEIIPAIYYFYLPIVQKH